MEKDDLVQPDASRGLPQCDQLHAADYTAMSGAELYQTCGTDAMQWAVAFNQHAVKLGYSNMDEGWLVGWFANPIMAMHDSIFNPPEGLEAIADLGADFDGDDMDAIEAADNVALSSEILSLRSQVEALKAALKPFAEAYDKHAWAFLDISDADAELHFLEGEASLADLRRARSVLSEKQS